MRCWWDLPRPRMLPSAALREFGNVAALNIPRNVAAGIATLTGNGASFGGNYQLAK